jgi:hypothetical protein
MVDIVAHEMIPGFEAPVHRALTEPILLAGAPRAVAILNGALCRDWPGAAAVDRGPRPLGDRPHGGGVGRQA